MVATGKKKAASGPRKRHHVLRTALLLPAATVCLLASAIARLSGETGVALADEVTQLALAHAAQPGPASAAQCPDDAELERILAALLSREERVVAAETRNAAREAEIFAAETRLSARLVELRQAEEQLAATMASASTAAQDDIARLVSVYEAMKPKDAAPLFDAMDPEFAAGFLSRMRPDAAAAILAGMSPERAYALSAIVAGRNAGVPVPGAAPQAGP